MIADDVNPAALGPEEFATLVKRSSAEQLLRLMHGEQRAAVLAVIFLRMPGVFRPDAAAGVREIVHWHIADRPDGGEDVYELVIAGGSCTVSAEPRQQPKLTLTIGAVDFLRMVTGNANPVTLFLRGRMKAKGDLGLTMRFPKMFDIPKK